MIVISAGALPEDLAMVSDLNVAGYLTKPLKIQLLREAVMRIGIQRYTPSSIQ
ncbi:hypothetical protein D3C87_2109390 [compost metagenome]